MAADMGTGSILGGDATTAAQTTTVDPAAGQGQQSPAQTEAEKTAAAAAETAKAAEVKAAADKLEADLKSTDPTVREAAEKLKKEQDDAAKSEKDKDKDKKAGAPEKYEAFKVPDGVQVDEAALKEFEPMARGLNLSQEQAQQLVDFYAAKQASGGAVT